MSIFFQQSATAKVQFRALPVAQRAARGMSAGWKWGMDGALLGLPLIVWEAATDVPGSKVPVLAARSAGLVTFSAISAVVTGGIAMIPGIGPGVATLLGVVMGMYINSGLENSMIRGIRSFSQLDKNVRRLEMGGDYQDTESASRQRMLAVQAMNASFQSSRRYLGQEARLMHR